MSLFDKLVSEALRSQGALAPLRSVVEKELLHHDILREMSTTGLLERLTFIGGTCLRMVYGSNRLSEDLDFAGGEDFSRLALTHLGDVLVERLQAKYNLNVEVSAPVKEAGNVSTWKLKVTTHPEQNHLPRQRIHIDICALRSYQKRPVVLRNHYGVEMGTSGLIVQAESREEILADKIVAFALRRNRIKNRDVWDIAWLKQQNVAMPFELIKKKVADRRRSVEEFVELTKERSRQLSDDPASRQDFISEMRRFLPPEVASRTVEKEEFWVYLTDLIHAEVARTVRSLEEEQAAEGFEM